MLVYHAFDNVFITDAHGRILFQNRASEDMLGFCALWPGSVSIQECIEKGVYDQSTAMEAVYTGKRVTGLVLSRQGSSLMSTSTPFFDENGNVSLVLTNARNTMIVDQFLTKLLENELLEKDRLQSLATYLGGLPSSEQPMLISQSPRMQAVLNLARSVAQSDSTVLLTGESGTGKDVIARYIHHQGTRRDMPFIPVNCSAIPHELLESEFFGYEKGAFTGAWRAKPGLFELADRGTLFLDEVGELPLFLQSKLLRALESGEIQRLGGTRPHSVSARIMAATNKDVKEMVQRHEFREDLYYRLNVIPINIPPLRERPEDIIPLASWFLDALCKKKRPAKTYFLSRSEGAPGLQLAGQYPRTPQHH